MIEYLFSVDGTGFHNAIYLSRHMKNKECILDACAELYQVDGDSEWNEQDEDKFFEVIDYITGEKISGHVTLTWQPHFRSKPTEG